MCVCVCFNMSKFKYFMTLNKLVRKFFGVSELDNRGSADGQVKSSPEAGVRHADHSAGHQPADAQCQLLACCPFTQQLNILVVCLAVSGSSLY